jgi:ribose 5-phosphate isomerase B
MTKTLIIGSDHVALPLKQSILSHFSNLDIIDMGPTTEDSVNYPDYATLVCEKVLMTPDSLGILICGSGIGMSIAANKIKGIRAALVTSIEAAPLSRQHNDANVLCLSGRLVDTQTNLAIVEAFLDATFEGDRHQRRIDKITRMEQL